MSALYANPVPFKFFAELIDQLSKCTARPKLDNPLRDQPSKQIRLVQRWIDQVKRVHGQEMGNPLPPGTVIIFFRLLFPEEGVRRRYGLQEYTFAKELEKHYRVAEGTFADWCRTSDDDVAAATGSLGETVKRWLERKGKCLAGDSALTLGRIDELLDELASTSTYSARDVQALRAQPHFRIRPLDQILFDLLHPLDASQTALMIQLILRDLSPILYPAPSESVSVSLNQYTSTCYDRIDLVRVMHAWDPRMARIHRTVADLDWVAATVEDWIRSGETRPVSVSPIVGLPIKVPKSQRPGTCSKATKHLSGKVAAETKYDGERLQVHINLDLPFEQQIRIFSKSGRDSTQTRHLLHPIIRASLGLDMGDRFASDQHLLLSSRAHTVRRHTSRRDPPPTTLVLEGEMVPYNEDTQRIDEFWKLAWATRSNSFPSSLTSPRKRSRVDNSPETGDTGDPATPKRSISSHRSIDINNLHLKIVWFDVLVAGQESLVHHTYSERMARLRELVQPIPGFSMLAEQVTLDFDDRATALANLRQHFAKVITDRCEGLMLKPITSTYNDSRRGQHWIKLKKDFIPGAGDTLDFVVVGASWQRQRARELLVPPSAYTTFFIGLEASDLGAPMHRANKKHYHILFSASYGLDRQQLDALCHSIRQDRPVTWEPYPGKQPDSLFRRLNGARGKHTVYESACTSFTFSLADHLYSYALRPTVIFREPREMELNGAGFQRTRGCDYYELRWPRITKFARTDAEPLTLSGLQRTARDAMQIEPEQTDSQIIADLFSWSKTLASPARPPKESPQAKYERELQDWLRRLEAADGIDEGASSSPSEEDNTGSDIVCFSDNEAVSAESAAPCIYRLSSPRATSRHAATLSDLEKTPPVMTSDMPVPVPNASLAKSTAQPSPNSKLGQPQSTSRRSPGGKRSLSDSVCQALEVKRRKLSQSELSSSTPRRSASTGHLSLTIANLLDSPSLTESKIPTFNHAWTLFPPRLACDNSELPIPAHPLLESLNYLSTPEHVLWAAGLRVQSRPRLGATQPRRQGWIFVSRGFEAEAIEWANTALISQDLPVEREARLQKQTVWLIKADALETKELGHLGFGDELLSIL